MFEPGQRVRVRIEGELEHVVTSPQGLRAAVKIGDGVSLTVPYPDLSPAGVAPQDDSPTSGNHLDPVKVADEIGRHLHVMVAPGPHECTCGAVLDYEQRGYARAHKLHQARAFCEAYEKGELT